MNYFQFTKKFKTENDAIDFIVESKYKNGYTCPCCGSKTKVYKQHYNHRFLYCNVCNNEFSALSNTIFENTHLDIRMWLFAINLILIAKKGVSALQLQRELGIGSYKSAWRMLHAIRNAMSKESFKEVFDTIVEIDETYVGGKPRKENVHNERETNEKHNKRGRGSKKTPVVGIKERSSGKIHAVVSLPMEDGKNLTGKQLLTLLNDVCKKGTTVMSDQYKGYNILGTKDNIKEFIHISIDHNTLYSLGDGMHTNGIESCWAILKRAVYGIYHHISIKYMQKYVDEFCFRLNNKDENSFEKLVELAVA